MKFVIPNDNPVLIDTSVWIDYLQRRNSAVDGGVEALLDQGRVATAAVILAELAQGAKSEGEIAKLRDYFKPFFFIESSDKNWQEAGALSFRLKRTGKNVNLTDCYIASLSQDAKASVFTLDKHFTWLFQIGGCRLFED